MDVAALHTVTRTLVGSVASIEPGRRTVATPCRDRDLTDLVDHITGGNWFTVAIVAGERAEEAMAAALERFGDVGLVDVPVLHRSPADGSTAYLEVVGR